MSSRAGRLYKSEAIILKRKNVGEADRIITVFAPGHGKLRLMAKGIRRITSRRAPHLEIFGKVILVVHRGKTFDTITEVTPLELYEPLRRDLHRVSLAYYLCELVEVLTPERQEQDDIYHLLVRALGQLADSEEKMLYRVSKQFTVQLLWLLGFLPPGKSLAGPDLQHFIENITERKLKTPAFARQVRER